MLKNIARYIKNRVSKIFPRIYVLSFTAIDYLRFYSNLKKHDTSNNSTLEYSNIKDILSKYGVCVIEDFWDAATCAEARAEVDRILLEYKDFVHPSPKADSRIFGAENLSDIIGRFSNHPMLTNLASYYNNVPSRTAFTMAAKMSASIGNLGSGEGWHRDAFFRQFKSIIYLSDVGEENGPFQLMEKSNKFWWLLKDTWYGRLGYMNSRISDGQVDELIRMNPSRLKTYTAKAGTLILVDTSSIHRGMPINNGVRYALTNYFFPEQRIGNKLFKHFAPVAGVIDVNRNFIKK